MKVYLPSWNGDMRLVSKDDETSELILVDPTPRERDVVGEFLRILSRRNWLSGKKVYDGPVPEKGMPYADDRMMLRLGAPIAKTSQVLIGLARPKDRTLTAVKFSSGKMEVVEGATVETLAEIEKTVERAKKEEDPKKEAAAASVKRPTPCCPQCLPGAVGPASEVLLSFLDPEQHESWSRERAILVRGHLSGHRYAIAHRHTQTAQRVGRICYDLDDQKVVHFHDWSVPPEEEVLAAKLILEHAEPWLRNEATVFGGGSDVYKNPFGGGGDGTESAALAMGVGQGILDALGMEAPWPQAIAWTGVGQS